MQAVGMGEAGLEGQSLSCRRRGGGLCRCGWVGGGEDLIRASACIPHGLLLRITACCQGLTGLINWISHTCTHKHTHTPIYLCCGEGMPV